MTKSLSNISSIATEETNTTGVLDSVLAIQPDDGTSLIFQNGVERGDQIVGIPIFASLQDSGGSDLPQDTRVALEFERPTDDNPSVVSEPKENTRVYRSLSLKEQQNEEYIDRTKHVLKDKMLVVRDVDTLYVSVDSSAQIDWSNSQLTFDENAIREV